MAQKTIQIALFKLNVQDDFNIRKMLHCTGETEYKISQFERLETGLTKLNSNNFSVVIADLTLPDSHGFDTFEKILNACPSLPIIVLTGVHSNKLGIKCVQHGAQDSLTKGLIDGRMLTKAIHYAIERNQMLMTLEEHRKALTESESTLSAIVKNSPDVILSLNQDGEILFINGRIVKNHTRFYIGKKVYNYIDENEHKKLQKILNRMFSARKILKTEIKGIDKTIWEVRLALIQQSKQKVSVLAIARDITEQKELERKVVKIRSHEKFLAYHDYLTKLPNRHLFFDRLEQTLSISKRYNNEFAVIFLDLNGFKLVNDNHGHQAGDFALQIVASRLKSALRESDTVSRLGGDEFVIIVRDLANYNHASQIAEKILKALSVPIHYEDTFLRLGCCMGISLFPFDGKTTDELVSKADTAMYRAKSVGRDCYRYFNSQIDKTSFDQTQLTDGLHLALNNNELLAYYQPQISLKNNQMTGVEALVRWQHPSRGFLHPGDFLHLAEKSNLMNQIDLWMFENACVQISEWKKQGIDNLSVSLNLNTNILSKSHLPEILNRNLQRSGVSAENLCLEITENHLIHDIDGTLEGLKRLKNYGYKLAIDDFGTGYSSLSYLSKFPVDYLKIDKSFLLNITESHDNAAITSAIISLGKNMKLDVIAEGVETQEQLEFLKSHDCDIIQGFIVSEPIPADGIRNQTWNPAYKTEAA